MKKETKSIGIISGKGGVGKTSLTASLASLAKKDKEIEALILDCDVDAPNLALILPAQEEDHINKKDTYTTLKAKFLEEKCVHCKQCIDDQFCEFKALSWNEDDQVPEIDYLACEGCGACKVLCPEHAFEINAVKSGEIISYESKIDLPLVYGKTRLGSTTSGKLVSDAKQFAKESEHFTESNLIIIDGPPGIGCPVIATVSGLDYIITITEPTPSGLHDVIRAIEVVHQFEIPFGIVINKYDIESSFQEEFKDFINKTGYKILGRIPFDLSIPKAMSFAEPVVDFAPDSTASKAIEEIYENIKRELWNES
ncbi:MAG: P-loop NTPase [Candidatus Lokiarchaeota archaeon]|nr:P-loop NTPase [Candidatus Lokiarchaeota archaeon]MBD3341847.1 P-loop NTPase [Candidatus Lokiarchaeota archaeon]